MLTITDRAPAAGEYQDRLVLPFDLRRKSRLRVRLESGQEAALLLERGGVLRGGDRLLAEDGRIVLVEAAPESVLRVTAAHATALARAAYHLGNRHVPLEIGHGWLRLEYDHVLEHMLEGLGVTAAQELAAFEPEGGAYGGGHGHHHDDGHDHHHGHDHDHTHHHAHD
jgi:urease accessory protein